MTKRNIAAIVASVIVLISSITGVIIHKKVAKKDNEVTTVITTESTSVKVEDEDSKFVVDLGTCHAYDNISFELLWNSLSKEDRARTKASGFSDAVSFPLKGMNDEEKIAEIREEILRNPVFGDMVARGFREVKLSDGSTTLADINPWINDFIAKTDKAMKNTEVGKRGIEIWLECRGNDGKYYVTEEYRSYTCGLATIIDRMVVVGISSRQSVLHFPLNDAVKDYARRVEKGDKQENKDAFVLKYFRKDGTKVFEIAFNMHDRRFELLKNYIPTPTTTQGKGGGPTPTTKKVITTKRVVTTTAPSVTKERTTQKVTIPKVTIPKITVTIPKITIPTLPSTSKSTTKPSTKVYKDPSKDPVNNGNANVGGGKNQPGDGAGTYQPTAERPPETTTKRVTTTRTATTTTKVVTTTNSGTVNLDNATPPTTRVIPTVTDSHDKPGNNAGSGNGAFSMD